MGRSVNYQSGAEYVKYFNVDPVFGHYNPETDEYEGDEFNEEEASWQFETRIDWISAELLRAFKSFYPVPQINKCGCYGDRRLHAAADPECWPVMANSSAAVYLSEYCGLVSVSFVPREYLEDNWGASMEGIQRHWLRQIEKKVNTIMENSVGRLVCCGRFSNGEAVYADARSRKAQLSAAAVNGERA